MLKMFKIEGITNFITALIPVSMNPSRTVEIFSN